MTARATRHWRADRLALWALRLGVPVAVGIVAYRNRQSLLTAGRLIGEAELGWLVPAALAIGGVYSCRANVYAVPLQILRYTFPRRILWATALVATSLHQLLPTGGASGYAFLTYAFNRRGVSGGRASLIALIDTLSYAIAVATLVVASVAYLTLSGALHIGALAGAFTPGLVLAAGAAYVYYLQRDQRRLTRAVLGFSARLKSWVAERGWSDEAIRRFLEQYVEAKAVIGKHRRAFAQMVGLQYLSIGCDAAALYLAFLALGLRPPVWVVLMGFVVAMAGATLIAVPGGGGSFEVVMSVFFAAHGVEPAHAIAAAVLYRLVAFWAPVALSAVVLLRLGRRRREIRPVG